MTNETKAVACDLKAVEPDGSFTGYASRFGVVDLGRDLVLPGAFAESIARRGARGIKMLFQHDPAEPIGVWLEVREDAHGLFARGRILLPNNRAVRAMTEAFVRVSGSGLLLPRLIPIGDPQLDDRIGGALEAIDDDSIPPAIEPLERLLALIELVRRPGVLPSLIAGQASFAVMVGIMTLTGSVVVDHHHHAGEAVFPIIGAHVIGMYALVLVTGRLIDRIGRPPALVGGLLVMAVSALSLLWVTGVAVTAVALFGLGIGWNLSFVAATATLADCAAPWERGKLLGFNDLLSGLTGATLVLIGGFALDAVGVAALALGGLAIALAPAGWIVRYSLRVRAASLAPSTAD